MKQTFGDFKVAGGIAYFEQEDEFDGSGSENVSGSISAIHVPTGLNLTFAAGESEDNLSGDEFSYWYVKAGIKQKIFPIGATAFSVDYLEEELDNGANPTRYGAQLVQYVDAAAMELYVAYQHLDDDDPVVTAWLLKLIH